MNIEPLNRYIVLIEISAACQSDAEELLNDYTGQETDLEILSIKEAKK